MTERPARETRTAGKQRRQEEAILAAAAEEFVSVGVRRASMEQIAELAEVSRSTLYRRFPSRDALVTAVGKSLRRALLADITTALAGLNPRQAVVTAFSLTVHEFRTDPLARRLISDEPESFELLVGLTGPNAEDLVALFSEAVASTLRQAGASMPDDELRLAAEVMFRLIASFAQTGSQALNFDDDDAVRGFAEKFLAPMIW